MSSASKSAKSAKPVFEPGTHLHLPGVPEPYAHGHVPRHGLGWSPAKGFHSVSSRDAHKVGNYEDGRFVNTIHYGEFPMSDKVPSERQVNHTVAFPPELGDVIAKLRRSAKDLGEFRPSNLANFDVFGTSPDEGDRIELQTKGEFRTGVDVLTMARAVQDAFENISMNNQDTMGRFMELLYEQNLQSNTLLINYSTFTMTDRANKHAVIFVLMNRIPFNFIYHPEIHGVVTRGVLYMCGSMGEYLFSMDQFMDTMLSTQSLDTSTERFVTLNAKGTNVFHGPHPADGIESRIDDDYPVQMQLMMTEPNTDMNYTGSVTIFIEHA